MQSKRYAYSEIADLTTELRDPFSAVTRSMRKATLITNLVLFAVVWGDLTPSKIETLGVTIETTNRHYLLGLMVAAALYFWAAFLFYACADLAAWNAEFESALEASEETIDERVEKILFEREPRMVLGAMSDERWHELVRDDVKRRREFYNHLWSTSQGRFGAFNKRRMFDWYVPLGVGLFNPIVCVARLVW
jgi:hypothetical protein